ncbi:MAG: FtsQ-type POTRA domain-containing protein [Desulfocapsaceae bacterium]|nr:FtsQ-type POTRA domain-containing protein [Desulfocapsaceae bacterium]
MVNKSQEIAQKILTYLQRKRQKSGYLKTLQKRHRFYGSSRTKLKSWDKFIQDFFSLSFIPRKKISYLSRSEKRKRYGSKIVRIALVVFTTAVILGVVHRPVIHYVETLNLFRIKEIVIHGCNETSRNDIKKIAGVDYKTSMVAISKEEIRKKLLEHSWIKEVRVEKVWPNQLEIAIKEHTASALLVKESGAESEIVFINKYGDVIAPIKPGDDLDYPAITGINNIDEGDKDQLYGDAVDFLRLIARNNPNLPAQSVSEINLDAKEGIIVRLVDFPFPIYFGRGEVDKKYRQLKEVLAVLYKDKKDTVDIDKVSYIRMEYYNNKVLVAQASSG